jgi:hypothetical protein
MLDLYVIMINRETFGGVLGVRKSAKRIVCDSKSNDIVCILVYNVYVEEILVVTALVQDDLLTTLPQRCCREANNPGTTPLILFH